MIGYARASTREGQQVFDRQVDALRAAGCERIYDDRGSGVSADRPGLSACLDYLRRDDVLVVLDLDRLGRRAGELIRLVDELERRGVGFRALKAPFDTTTPAGRAFMQIQAAFAEMERNLIRQRISEGIAAARARGRKGGRPRVMTPERLRYAQHLMADQTRSIPAICRELGDLPASTLYHYVHADGSLKAPGRKLLDADMHGAGADPAKEASGGPAAVEAPRARADA
jgi:DNA invertase Pin-like site-specific DNA recombinase